MARPKSFAARLKRLRERAGLTQASLAERAGLTQPTIARLETGRRGGSISAAAALKLARAFGVTVEQLLEGKE